MKPALSIPVLAIGFFGLALLHLSAGARMASLPDVWSALTAFDRTNYLHTVIILQRLTRLAVAVYAGCVLSVAGLLLQKIMRNDLVSPSTLGINSGAAALSVASIYFFGLSGAALFWPALLGGIAAIALTFCISGVLARGSRDPLNIVLAGAMTAMLFSSATTFLVSLDPDAFGNLMGWLVGDIGNFDYQALGWLWPVGALGIAAAFALSRRIDLLMLGKDQAASLGTDPRLVYGAALATAIVLAISAVCVVGPIGFVGLVVPHLARMTAGESGSAPWWTCLVAGPAIVTLADLAARTLLAPRVLNVGTVMGLMGGAAFLVIIITVMRRRPA
jgi:iron complex transport system permease protein